MAQRPKVHPRQATWNSASGPSPAPTPGSSRPSILWARLTTRTNARSLTQTLETRGWNPQKHYGPHTGRVDIIGALAAICLPGGAEALE